MTIVSMVFLILLFVIVLTGSTLKAHKAGFVRWAIYIVLVLDFCITYVN